MSDRPTKTGRQLQSVAKQFGSIGKTVGADADQNYADADGDTMTMLIMLLLIMLTLLLLMLMIWVLIILIMLTLLLLMLMMCGLMLMLFSSGEQEDQEEPWEHHTTCQVLLHLLQHLPHLPPHDKTDHHCLRTGSFKRDSGGVSQSGRRASCRIVGGQQVFLCLQSFFLTSEQLAGPHPGRAAY